MIWVPRVGPIEMNELIGVPPDEIRTGSQPVEQAPPSDGLDAQHAAFALDLDRNARLEHLVEDPIDVGP
jgi:hypothetical protein